MDIAVLGMGRMGQALAGRLLEGGHRVAVWNRSRGKTAKIVSGCRGFWNGIRVSDYFRCSKDLPA